MTLDFASHADYLVALLPECILTGTALVVVLGDAFSARKPETRGAGWTGWLSVLALVLAGAAALRLAGVRVSSPETAAVAVDGFRIAASLVVLGGAAIGLLFSFDYLDRERLPRGEFYALVLLATVGMLVLVAARDLILLFVGLELMSITVYVLTGYDRRNPRSSEAGLKYFLIGAFASAFFLYGVALLYGAAGSTRLAAVAPRVAEAAAGGDPLLIAGVGMLLIGFGFKISAVPFHMWTPDAYQGAPTPVTGFMAAGVKAAAFVALVRVVTVDLAPAADVWQGVLWWLAMLTMIVPNLIALAQENVKRMLAYSSVAHAGYLLVGVVAWRAPAEGGVSAPAAVLFYLGVYALMTLGAFAVVYKVAGQGDRRADLGDYQGLGWRRPVLGVALVIFLLSLAGFPPTGGFVGKLYLLRVAVDADRLALAITLVLTSLVSYYYYFRVVWKMYFDEAPEEAPAPAAAGGAYRLAAVLCVVGVLASGLVPGPALETADRVGGLAPAAPAEGAASAAPDDALAAPGREGSAGGPATLRTPAVPPGSGASGR